MTHPDLNLPNRIRHWRNLRGITQQDLAKRVGMTKGHLSKMELGQRELTLVWMERLAKELDVTAADLVNKRDGGLSPDERRIIDIYRATGEAAQHTISAVAEAQMAYRGEGDALPFERKSA